MEKIKYDNSYEKWVNNRYNDGYLHQIVNIVKWSMNELGKSKPNVFLQLINKSDPSSALIGNEIVLSAIYNLPISYADEAASTFNNPKYHTNSQEILLKMIESNDVEATAFSTDYLKENISIERDHDFLFRVFQTKTGTREIIPFLKYLNESDTDITCFADIIQLISSQVFKISEDYRQRMAIELLIPSVLQLFDKGKEDLTITTICLDIWDKLFQDNLSYIKPLGDMIDQFD